MGFGSQLTGVDMMAAFNHNVDNAFIGRVLGTTSLGLYSIALRVPELAVRNLGVVAGQILFPAFTATQPEAVGRAFRVSLRLMVLITLPVSVALAVLAEPLVLAFFGDQWLGSIDALRVIAITAFASTVGVPAGSAYKAAGRGGLLLMLSVPRAVLLVFALVLFIDEGIVAVAICQAVITALMAVAGLVVARTVLGVGLRQSAGAMGVAVVPSAALGLAAAGAVALLDGTGAWPMLVGGSVAGGAVFLVTLWLTAPAVVADVLARVRRSGAWCADAQLLAGRASPRQITNAATASSTPTMPSLISTGPCTRSSGPANVPSRTGTASFEPSQLTQSRKATTSGPTGRRRPSSSRARSDTAAAAGTATNCTAQKTWKSVSSLLCSGARLWMFVSPCTLSRPSGVPHPKIR